MTEGKELLAKWLNKTMRVRITDDRILIGSFLCTDKDQNLILGSSQEYINSTGMNLYFYYLILYLKEFISKK